MDGMRLEDAERGKGRHKSCLESIKNEMGFCKGVGRAA